jgi:hypothetical protein
MSASDEPRRSTKDCDSCSATGITLNRHCGAYVCFECEAHVGLDLCYCGWSRYGGDGRQQLEDVGEVIEEDY